jgi:hypothetical protein
MQRTDQTLSSVNMSTGIPKNMITVHFNGSNLDTWAPQVHCTANPISVCYLVDKTEINFTNQIKQIDALKALMVITTSITPAVDKVICSLKKRNWDPTTAAAQVPLPGTQLAPGTAGTAVKHKPAGNPQWCGGNSGSLCLEPKYNTKRKKGNGARSNAPGDGNLRNKCNSKLLHGPNRSGKGPNSKRHSRHAHAVTTNNLGMHFAASAVHIDTAPPQVCPTATQLQRQAAHATWPQGVPRFSKAVIYCNNVGASLDSAAFAALADIACAGIGEHSDRLDAGRNAGLHARAAWRNQPLCNYITSPLATPVDKAPQAVSERRHTLALAEQLGPIASKALPCSSTTSTYHNKHKDGFKPLHLVCSASEEQGQLAELMARTTRNFKCASIIPVDVPKEDNNNNNNLPSVKPHHCSCCCKACGHSNKNKNPTGFKDMGCGVKRALPATNNGSLKRQRHGKEDLVLLGTTNYNFEPIAGLSGTLHNNNVLSGCIVEVPKEDDNMMYVPPFTPHVHCADTCHAADAYALLLCIYNKFICTTVEQFNRISCVHVEDVALCVTCKEKALRHNYWLLDSGQKHYVDYTPWTCDNYGYVCTATTTRFAVQKQQRAVIDKKAVSNVALDCLLKQVFANMP